MESPNGPDIRWGEESRRRPGCDCMTYHELIRAGFEPFRGRGIAAQLGTTTPAAIPTIAYSSRHHSGMAHARNGSKPARDLLIGWPQSSDAPEFFAPPKVPFAHSPIHLLPIATPSPRPFLSRRRATMELHASCQCDCPPPCFLPV